MFQTITPSSVSSPSPNAMLTAQTRRTPVTHRRRRASTIEAYERDVARFISAYGGKIPCSAEDLIAYILVQVKRVAPNTVARRCMAIQHAHRKAGHTSPTEDHRVREAMRWLAAGQAPVNLLGKPKNGKPGAVSKPPAVRERKAKPAKPVTRALLDRIIDSMGTGRRSLDRRDLVVLLLGFAGLKRGTLCALNIEDLEFTADVLLIRIRSQAGEETGEEGADSPAEVRQIALAFTRGPLCAATAVQNWLRHNDLEGKSGPLLPRFARSGEPIYGERLDSAYVSVIVKKRLLAAGVTDVSDYSAESLRRGHELESLRKGGL